MHIGIVYISLSGNTHDLAMQLEHELNTSGHSTTCINIYHQQLEDELIEKCDLLLIGSYTWGKDGVIPVKMRKLLKDIIKVKELKLPKVAVFGTGEMQWGSNYCRAVDEMAYHLGKVTTVLGTLKVEQSPRGNQEHLAPEFLNKILKEY